MNLATTQCDFCERYRSLMKAAQYTKIMMPYLISEVSKAQELSVRKSHQPTNMMSRADD